MVPPESFSIDAPHSSIDFCSGCDGGTQCESLSSNVLSWADAAAERETKRETERGKPAELY